MTEKEKQDKTFSISSEAKKAGWFSRRHATNEAHLVAQEDRVETKDRPTQKWVGGEIKKGGHWVHETKEEA